MLVLVLLSLFFLACPVACELAAHPLPLSPRSLHAHVVSNGASRTGNE
jgi:hypothetical protein